MERIVNKTVRIDFKLNIVTIFKTGEFLTVSTKGDNTLLLINCNINVFDGVMCIEGTSILYEPRRKYQDKGIDKLKLLDKRGFKPAPYIRKGLFGYKRIIRAWELSPSYWVRLREREKVELELFKNNFKIINYELAD